MSVTKKVLLVFLPFIFVACKSKKEEQAVEEPVIASEVALAEVTSGSCLNLEKLSRVLQNPQFSVPAAIMTTSLKPIGEMSPSRLNYFSYATFNYKISTVNELGLFTQLRQKDCKTVQMLSASEEVMTFEIVSSSQDEITIKLKDKYRDTMIAAHKKALFERQQPTQLSYKFTPPHSLLITEKYSTVDPICVSKESLSFEIRRDLRWASRVSELPQSYNIDSEYLNHVKESVLAEALGQVSVFESPENVSVEAIRAVMRTPLKEELKLCGQ